MNTIAMPLSLQALVQLTWWFNGRAERKAKIEATLNAVGAKRNGDVSPSAMIEAGFDPLTEPYLQMLIQKLSEDQLKSLKKGKLAFPSAAGPVSARAPRASEGGRTLRRSVFVASPKR